jgi:hypothetical protein
MSNSEQRSSQLSSGFVVRGDLVACNYPLPCLSHADNPIRPISKHGTHNNMHSAHLNGAVQRAWCCQTVGRARHAQMVLRAAS